MFFREKSAMLVYDDSITREKQENEWKCNETNKKDKNKQKNITKAEMTMPGFEPPHRIS